MNQIPWGGLAIFALVIFAIIRITKAIEEPARKEGRRQGFREGYIAGFNRGANAMKQDAKVKGVDLNIPDDYAQNHLDWDLAADK